MQPIFNTNNYDIFKFDGNDNFHFPYILCIPKNIKDGDTIFMESNNEENPDNLIKSAEHTVENILNLMNGSSKKSPIFIPILPTKGLNGSPYYQQLSKECFDKNNVSQEIPFDQQIINSIKDVQTRIFEITGKKVDEKVFLHGYSASGVFAQRFALVCPEIIKEVCIGGAIGSIPMPLKEYDGIPLDYPIGVNDFKELFCKEFNDEAYKQIKFRYYVAELEDQRLSESRKTEDGQPAPMHDMSYMDRSVPKDVGQNLRNAFGRKMNERCANQLRIYKQMGLDISTLPPIPNIMHNEIKNLAYKYIDDCMHECINEMSII